MLDLAIYLAVIIGGSIISSVLHIEHERTDKALAQLQDAARKSERSGWVPLAFSKEGRYFRTYKLLMRHQDTGEFFTLESYA